MRLRAKKSVGTQYIHPPKMKVGSLLIEKAGDCVIQLLQKMNDVSRPSSCSVKEEKSDGHNKR